jgi:hypothetical protein
LLEWVVVFMPAGMEEVVLAGAVDGVSLGVALLLVLLLCSCCQGICTGSACCQSYIEENRVDFVSQDGQQYVWVCVFAKSRGLNCMCALPRVGGALCAVLEVPEL